MRDIPKFPASPRDLTLILSEATPSDAVTSAVRTLGKDLVQAVDVFDSFTGGKIPKGKKSLSFRIFYQAKDRTLQNEEVNQLHFSIVDSLSNSLGAQLPRAKTDST